MTRCLKSACIIGIFVGSSVVASAGTVNATTAGPLPPNMITISMSNVAGLPGGVYNGTVFAGAIEWARNSGGTDSTPFIDYNLTTGAGHSSLSKFTTFCIDIIEDVYVPNGTYTYDVQDLTKAPKKAGVPYTLIDTTKKQILETLWGEHITDAFASGATQAAFQAAIWNIVFDGDSTVTAGDFKMDTSSLIDQGIASTANGWLVQAIADKANPLAKHADLVALTSPLASDPGGANAQDQLVAVPLPAAVQAGAALIGMLGVGRLCSRIRQRKTNA